MYIILELLPGGGFRGNANPAVHKTLDDAETEARRLVKTTTGKKFVVFEPILLAEHVEVPIKVTAFRKDVDESYP